MLEHRLEDAGVEAALAGQLAVTRDEGGIRPLRLPESARRRAAPMLRIVSGFTPGIRLRLHTGATRLSIDATVTRLVMAHLGAPAAPATFVVEVDGVQTDRIDLDATALVSDRDEPIGTASGRTQLDLSLGSGGTAVTLWLPTDAAVVLHAVTADAPLAAAPPESAPVWLHHGSSISQCGDAQTPLTTWPQQASRALGVASTNLGFGGNAMLDGFVARAIAEAPADLITLKFGINLVTSDAMRVRTFQSALHEFLDVIRDRRPDVPICVLTAIGNPALERTPGPLRTTDGGIAGTPRETRPGDGTLTLEASRAAVAAVVEQRRADDAALFLQDGPALLGVDEGHLLGDGLHPTQEGYDLIAARFAALARDPGTGLGAAFAALS